MAPLALAATMAAATLLAGIAPRASAVRESAWSPEPPALFSPVPSPPASQPTPALARRPTEPTDAPPAAPSTSPVPPRVRQAPGPAHPPLPRQVAPRPRPALGGGPVRGVATWYCEPGVSVCTAGYDWRGAYGAAGPALRAALGPRWRGRTVYVNGVAVRLVDWCACGGGHVIDVYHATWLLIPHPSEAVVTW